MLVDILQQLDVRAFWLVHSGASHATLDGVARAFSGPWPWILAPTITILVGLFRWRSELVRATLLAIVAIAITDLFCARLKQTPPFIRIRPCHQFVGKAVPPSVECGHPYGFPSNHAANAMTMASVFFFGGARGAALWLLPMVLAIGLSRVYLAVHFPGDVLGGFLIGGTIGWIVARVAGASVWRRLRPA